MVNSSLLYLSLIATFYFASSALRKDVVYQNEMKTWEEARQHCQEHYFDLHPGMTSNMISFMVNKSKSSAWMGLRRDPVNESAWRFISARKEELNKPNVSLHGSWAAGERESYCVAVQEEEMYTLPCSPPLPFYCSNGNTTFHNLTRRWYFAQIVCKRYHSELATVTWANAKQFKELAWIGLYRVSKDQWRWADGASSDYRNWAEGHPVLRDCGYFDAPTLEWHSSPCHHRMNFFCFDYNLVLVNERKTWEEALVHCRNMGIQCKSQQCNFRRSDLVSLKMHEFHATAKVMELATTDEVWTGLRFLAGAWFWVNNARLRSQANMTNCPPAGKHCGIISKANPSGFQARDCSERKNFICYKV